MVLTESCRAQFLFCMSLSAFLLVQGTCLIRTTDDSTNAGLLRQDAAALKMSARGISLSSDVHQAAPYFQAIHIDNNRKTRSSTLHIRFDKFHRCRDVAQHHGRTTTSGMLLNIFDTFYLFVYKTHPQPLHGLCWLPASSLSRVSNSLSSHSCATVDAARVIHWKPPLVSFRRSFRRPEAKGSIPGNLMNPRAAFQQRCDAFFVFGRFVGSCDRSEPKPQQVFGLAIHAESGTVLTPHCSPVNTFSHSGDQNLHSCAFFPFPFPGSKE